MDWPELERAFPERSSGFPRLPNVDRDSGVLQGQPEGNRQQVGEPHEYFQLPEISNPFSDFPDLEAELAAVESELIVKFEDIQRWQLAASSGPEPLEESKIQLVYNGCIGYFSILLPELLNNPKCGSDEKIELRRSFKLLRVWGEAYSVSDGGLDHLTKDAGDVSDTVLLFLIEISSILSQRISALTGKWKSSHNELLERASNHLQSLLNKARSADLDDDGTHGEETVLDESDTESEDTLQQCVTDIQEYIQLLNELHPSIESFLELLEDAPGPSLAEAANRGAFLYFSDIIRSKFKEAPEALADTLGRLNLERYNRMAAARDVNLGREYDFPQTNSIEAPSTSFHDSGIGGSLPSQQSMSEKAPSLFSTLAGKSRSKLPPLPAHAKWNSFSCNYCGEKVRFCTRREWEKHLIEDLQPYSCLELDCPHSIEPFATRDEWVGHLARDHNMAPDWESQQCTLCQEWIESGMIGICKHFADHLEDIAIAASPLNVTSEDGSDAVSVKSQGDMSEKTNNLQTIREETEMEEDSPYAWTSKDSQGDMGTHTSTKISSQLAADDNDPPQFGSKYKTIDRDCVDLSPNCAICNGAAFPECPCESERLQIAVKQAETRSMGARLMEIRDWVIMHARTHILNAFERLAAARKATHSAYLSSLPFYSIYMKYSGHPPLSPTQLANLQAQISDAHAELKRGIDADWRASTLRYPEILSYFYSIVELQLPGERSAAVTQPPFSKSGSGQPRLRAVSDGQVRRKTLSF